MTGRDTGVDPAAPVAATPAYRRLVLGLLLAAYTLNFIDRTIIGTIGQAIKTDLGLSDTQLGLLGGLYFALLYTFLGLPIARLAERFNRVNIIAAAVLIWSGFTALCGVAGNFAQLAACRFGVGFGEAGCSPPAHALISDYFEPKKRASALGVYAFGIPLGTMFGAACGGWIAQHFSWRLAFMLVGLPGLVVAAAIKLLLREPRVAPPPRPAAGLGHELAEIWAVTRTLFGQWPVLHVVLGVTIASFAAYGAGAFAAPWYLRTFRLDLAEVGLIIGLVAGVSQGAGTLLGGFLSDRLGARAPRWYGLTPAIGLTIAAPLYLISFHQTDWRAAAAWLLLPGMFHYFYLAPSFAVVQNAVEARRRATATAVLFLFLNLIGLGGGPPFTGWLIDQFAALHFSGSHAGVLAGLPHAIGLDASGFKAACPGGHALPHASAAAAAACRGSVAEATRDGILVTVALYFWAAAHYALGAIGMAKVLGAGARAG